MEFKDLFTVYNDVTKTRTYGSAGQVMAPTISCVVESESGTWKKTMSQAELDLIVTMRKIRGFISDNEMMELIDGINRLCEYERAYVDANRCDNF